VLERGQHAGALQAAHVSGAEQGHQVRVLADGLLDPAPPVVADHVEHGGQALVDAERRHVPADRGGHPLDQVGIERRTPGNCRRIDGRSEGSEPGEAFLVHDGRYAQSGVGQHDALLAYHLGRALRGGDRHTPVHPGEVAEPGAARLGERSGPRRREDILHRRDVQGLLGVGASALVIVVLHVVTDPPAAELG
jgi:hypothetical protein